MQIALKSVWATEFTGQELTLISKALTCTLTPGEKKQAWHLAKKMAEARANEAEQLAEINSGALTHFETEPKFEG